MRDYDETFKEMKKENFNLKLRIFFLEVSLKVLQRQKLSFPSLSKMPNFEHIFHVSMQIEMSGNMVETCHQMKYVVEFQSPAWTRYVSKGRF